MEGTAVLICNPNTGEMETEDPMVFWIAIPDESIVIYMRYLALEKTCDE